LAKQANAVNTIHKKNNLWYGYNTDIDGFIRPIKSIIKSISNVLVIGAGGASNAICFSLLQYSGIKSLTILNRTVGKARKIKEILENHYTVEIVSESLNYKNQTQFDLIVNTTSVGMGSSQNETPFDFSDNCHSKTIVYDLIYNPEKTLFLSNAESHGLTFINGLEMLVGQAEKSFKIWTGDNYPEKILTRDIFYKKA